MRPPCRSQQGKMLQFDPAASLIQKMPAVGGRILSQGALMLAS